MFRNLRALASIATAGFALFLAATPALAADDITGTWTLVSSVTEKDGKRTDQFGTGPKGMLVLDRGGRFSLTIIGPNLPKFASGNRAAGTPEETQAVVSSSIAMLGTYAYDAAAKTLVFHVESSTFPNWNGTDQKRLVSVLSEGELRYVTPTASSGGVGTVTWSRGR